jgi:nucleotide-binding universal stress UspA family protein
MNIKEIVFPIDFSDRSVEACPYVAALTRVLGAKLTLLHVVESLPRGSSPLDRLHTEEEAALKQRKEEAYAALAAFQGQYIPHVPSQLCVLVGDPATGIVICGGQSRGRMIVMPTRGFGPFRRMLLGSVTAKVLHDAECPVLTGPHLEKAIHPDQWLKLRRMLCAVSLDWETDGVLTQAAGLADQLGADLVAMHAIAPLEEGLLPLVNTAGIPASIESIQRVMEDALNRTGVNAEIEVQVGEASRRVACTAKEENADLIVIGRGGRPDLPGRLGSHAYAIVRRAPCPVLRV